MNQLQPPPQEEEEVWAEGDPIFLLLLEESKTGSRSIDQRQCHRPSVYVDQTHCGIHQHTYDMEDLNHEGGHALWDSMDYLGEGGGGNDCLLSAPFERQGTCGINNIASSNVSNWAMDRQCFDCSDWMEIPSLKKLMTIWLLFFPLPAMNCCEER